MKYKLLRSTSLFSIYIFVAVRCWNNVKNIEFWARKLSEAEKDDKKKKKRKSRRREGGRRKIK